MAPRQASSLACDQLETDCVHHEKVKSSGKRCLRYCGDPPREAGSQNPSPVSSLSQREPRHRTDSGSYCRAN